VQRQRLDSFQSQARRAEYQAHMEAFSRAVQRDQVLKKDRKAKIAELLVLHGDDSASPRDKRRLLKKILETDPDDRDILVKLAFYSAMEEAWVEALEYARGFLKREGRENARRLSVGLLEAEILHYIGRQDDARASLEAYAGRTRDPWYESLSEVLLGKRTEDSLNEEAGESPEKLVVFHTALGFWAEGSGDKESAIEHYKVALTTFMDTWLEFDFARERIKSLRQPTE